MKSNQIRKGKIVTRIDNFNGLLSPVQVSGMPEIVVFSFSHSPLKLAVIQIYILIVSEIIEMVARKYRVAIGELKNIISYRTFSKPFAALPTSDEKDGRHTINIGIGV
ncbi:hypothetical protein C9426_25000 [Serratia sp. S1B]|nr:hypothetical protein C9426_25000 [Serratia sp. S1B]